MSRARVLIGVGVACAMAVTACTSGSADVTSVVAEQGVVTTTPGDSTGSTTTPTTTPTTASTTGGTATSEPSDGTSGPLPDIPLPDIPLEDLAFPPGEVELNGDVRTGQLDNGLTYFVQSNDNPGDRADIRLAIDAGSVNEDEDQSGMAHFLEHMLFNGTEKYPSNELVAVLRSFGADFGADVNASTGYDETVYRLTLPAEREALDLGVDVLAQWLTAATIDQTEVELERGVVLDEWRNGQTLGGRVFDQIADLFFTGSAYEGRRPIGERESIETTDAAPLRRFYDRWYRPDNAAVVAIGDFDVDQMVARIEAAFAGAVPRGDAAGEIDRTVTPSTEPQASVLADPDANDTSIELTLPLAVSDASGTSAMYASMVDTMLFEALARRLQSDISRGMASFESANRDSNSHVRLLDAPSVLVVGTPDEAGDALDALITEFRRAELYGFSQPELDVVLNWWRSFADNEFDGRNSRQDSSYAGDYVDYFLSGDPAPDNVAEYDLTLEMLDSITLGQLNQRLRTRWAESAPHLLIVGPEGTDLPTGPDALDTLAAISASTPDPRPDEAPAPDELMERPDPVEETSSEVGVSEFVPYVNPTALTFDNSIEVSFNETPIEEGYFRFEARSPGGTVMLSDELAIDAYWVSLVMGTSGVGQFDQVQLDQFLAPFDAAVTASIDPYTEGLFGGASTGDAEILFQLINRYLTAPRFDQVALDNALDRWRPLVEDMSTDQSVASYDALLDAMYGGDPRFTYLPEPDEFATVDLAGVAAAWEDRTSNLTDWSFVFSGDLDIDEMTDLARRYIGTLPGDAGATNDNPPDATPDIPAGVTSVAVAAGTGDTGTVTVVYETDIESLDGRSRVLGDVTSDILSDRLRNTLREELGESYSPYASVSFEAVPGPVVSTYIEVSGDPTRLELIASLVQDTIAGLRTDGPTEAELSTVRAVYSDQYDLYNNGTIIDELLSTMVPPRNTLDWFSNRSGYLAGIDATAVRSFVETILPDQQYVEVLAVPR